MRSSLLLVAVVGCLAVFGCAGPAPVSSPHGPSGGEGALVRLAPRLRGTWTARLGSGKELTEAFREISGGSALLETFTTASGRETINVFHADHEALVVTHYCAQGNQPRLRLADASADTFTFRFVDATNLKPGASHLVELVLRFDGASRLEQTEVYEDERGAREATTLVLTRAAPPPAA